MLLQHHGASTLSRILRQPVITMTSFSGTGRRYLATDTKDSILPSLERAHSTVTRRLSPNQNKVWNPSRAILFESYCPAGPRPLSTNPVQSHNREHHALHTDTHDVYALTTSTNLPLSDFDLSQSPVISSDDSGDSSWAPSTLSKCPGLQEQKSEEEVETEAESHTPLNFLIPEDVLQRVKDATPGTKESFWTHKLYVGPDNKKVKVHYCKSKNTTERVMQYFSNEKVLGFDIEWQTDSTRKSGIKSNVALIQLACEDRIALFHIALYPKDAVSDLVSPTLKKIMENADITKVGVAIKADCTRLRTYLEIDSKGIFELSHLYKLVRYSSSGDFNLVNKRLVSLAKQVEEHLELPIFKGDVRQGDWSQPLSMDQIIYAASDSYANFILHDILEYKRKQLKPTPPRPYNVEHNNPIRLASGVVIPVPDEGTEEPELVTASEQILSAATPISDSEAASENIQIEKDLEPTAITVKKSDPKMLRSKARDSTNEVSRPQALIDAEEWASAHRAAHPAPGVATKPPNTVTFSALRTYALWHLSPSLSISDIGALLRDPPLQSSTVISYVLDAIRVEKLPFEKQRLKAVLQMMPDTPSTWRFRGLRKLTCRDP